MKITTLMENTAVSPKFTAEHGLSLFVETERTRFLFDAGQTGAFGDNARALGVDLGEAEFAILSHGHYDHGGGLLRFLEINPRARVYLNEHAFGDHRNGSGKYIGLAPRLRDSGRLVLTGDTYTVAPGLTLQSCNALPRPVPTDPFGLTELVEGAAVPERFLHEHYLLAEEEGKRILFSGCSHKGILNILHWFRPDVLVGGFHFKQLDPASPRLLALGEAMAKFDTLFYTGHCTGTEQYEALKSILGDRLHAISTGTVVEI